MKIRATYRNQGNIIRTRYYATAEEAQEHLRDRIGSFRSLGRVSGDVFENGKCEAAPRNGGLVTIEIN